MPIVIYSLRGGHKQMHAHTNTDTQTDTHTHIHTHTHIKYSYDYFVNGADLRIIKSFMIQQPYLAISKNSHAQTFMVVASYIYP